MRAGRCRSRHLARFEEDVSPLAGVCRIMMRGVDETSESLFSYAGLEARILARHPLCKIRQVFGEALASLDAEFEAPYINSNLSDLSARRGALHRAANPGQPDQDSVLDPVRAPACEADAV